MRIVTNQKLIRRNARIGNATSLLGMVLLVGGLLYSFKVRDTNTIMWLWGVFLVGFILSQIGIYYGNRWGRSPRPDEIMDKSLKGLGREYTIYHYVTPGTHLLVGPAGVWALLPFNQSGIITYEKGRWKARGGGFAQAYLRIFGQENIGRPDLDAVAEIDTLKRYLTRTFPEGTEIPQVQAALLFTNPKTEIKVIDAPLPALAPKDLKDYLREKAKGKLITTATLEIIQNILPKPEKEEKDE